MSKSIIQPDLPKYSLKQSAEIITKLTGEKHTKNNLIELAKEGEIQLCINKPDWKYVRLDEKNNEMEKLYCKPLNTWLIVPVDRHCTGTADGVELMWNKPPIPHLRQTDICSMYANNEKEIFIDSHNMTAEYEGEIIRVSKVGYARLPEPEDNNYQDFERWLWRYRMRIGHPSESKKVKTLTIYDLQENSNFFFSLAGFQGRGVSINLKELCVTRQELDRVVTKSLTKPIQPDLPQYSLKQSAEIITKLTGEKHTKNNLIELAKNNKLNMSFHKSDWDYVRIDKQGYEMETVRCDSLGMQILVPVDRKKLRGNAPPYYKNDKSIYPYIQSSDLKNMDTKGDVSIFIHNLKAYDNERISVSAVDRTLIPKQGDDTYEPFNTCLFNVGIFANRKPVDVSEYYKEGYYYQLKRCSMTASTGIDHFISTCYINKKDFCITKKELSQYLEQPKQLEANEPDHETSAKRNKLDKAKEALWVIEACYDEDGECKVTQGSGFQLQDEGIITCDHVVTDDDGKKFKELKAYKVSIPSNKYYLKVDKICSHRDVAICSISLGEEPPRSYLKKSQKEAEQQLGVKLLGFPAHGIGDEEPSVVDAKIARSYSQSGVQKFEIDQSIREGNSGGPIIDMDFNVIGIALEGATKESGRNGCLHISELAKLASN